MAKNGKPPTAVDPDFVGEIPEDILELIKKDTKPLGYSTKREDTVLPLIRLLQKGSPQVDERGAEYVAGARAGDFWFKNAEKEIVAGDLGFDFWPLGYHKNFIEWRPNRGGYVTAHLDPPPEAKWRVEVNKENNRERKVLALPNGNYLEETAYHYGLVNGSIWVLTFRSAGLANSRAFNTAMGDLKLEGHPLDSYGGKITSKTRTSAEYEWYAVKFALLYKYGQCDDQKRMLMPHSMYRKGRELTINLAKDIDAGAKVIEREEPAAGAIENGTGKADDGQEPIPF